MSATSSRLVENTSFEDLFKGLNLNNRENIKKIQIIAKSTVLPSQYILKLIDEIGSKKLSISKKRALLCCIIPNHRIPEDAFIRMTYFLSDHKFDLILKIDILKWMIETIPFLQNPSMEKFHCLYEIILRLLKFEVLRPFVINLLHLITTKELITSERINYIVKFCNEYEHQECFMSILGIYYKLQPTLVNDILPGCKQTFKEALDSKLSKHISEFSLNQDDDFDVESLNSLHFKIEELDADDILSVYRTSCTESIQIPVYNSFDEVYRKFLILKESSMQQILQSDFRRLLFTSNKTMNVQTSFLDYILSSLSVSRDFDSALPVILEVLHEKQEPIAAVSEFMDTIIDLWDGYSNFHVFLDILSYQDICCFEKTLYKMDILREIVRTAPVNHKCHLFHCFSKIYQNWAYTEYSEHIPCEGGCSLSSEDELLSGGNLCHLQMNEIRKYGSYIDLLCDDLISDDDFHPCLLNQVLLHYERMSIAHMKNDNLILHLPTHTVLNSALLSLNLSTLENLCQLMLWLYTDVCSEAKKNHPETKLAKQYFVACLVDLRNILWNDSGLHDITYLSKTNVYQKLKQFYPNFSNLFVLYKNPALLLKTMCFFKNQLTDFSTVKDIPDVEKFFAYLLENRLEHFVNLMRYFNQQYPVKE